MFLLRCFICILITQNLNRVQSAGLSFIREPISDFLVNGAVTFSCEPSPAFAMVEWLREDKPLNLSEQSKYVINHFQRGLVYSITVREKTTAIYNCVISIPGLRLVSRPAEAIANTIGKFPQGEDRHIEVGKSSIAVVPCGPLPSGVPIPIPIVTRNGWPIPNKGRFELLPSGNLYIHNAIPEDSGQYVCSAENPFTNEKVVAPFKVNLLVNEHRVKREPHVIHKPLEKIEAVAGTNVTFECLVDGSPRPKISWRRVGSYLPVGSIIEHGLLKLFAVEARNIGIYECNASSNGISRVIAQTILIVQEPPQIEPPKIDIVEIEEGHPITLECNVIKGEPKPLVKWLHNGHHIKTNEKNRIFVTQIELHIGKSNKTLHAGHYQCFAANELDTTYAKYLVRIVTLGEMEHRQRLENRFVRKLTKRQRPHKEVIRHLKPPKPVVQRLSKKCALVQWKSLKSQNHYLKFLKVQYHPKGKSWRTWDGEILPDESSVEICDLSVHQWRFRLVAVFHDDDNRAGKPSEWLHNFSRKHNIRHQEINHINV